MVRFLQYHDPMALQPFPTKIGISKAETPIAKVATLTTYPFHAPLRHPLPEGPMELKAARVLLERGLNTTARSRDGPTPLHIASFRGHWGLALVLLEHGADATAQTKDGSRSEEHTSELQSHVNLVCRLL